MATRLSEIVQGLKAQIGTAERQNKQQILKQMLKSQQGEYVGFAVIRDDNVIKYTCKVNHARRVRDEHDGSEIVLMKMNVTMGRKVMAEDLCLPIGIWAT